VDVLNKLLGNSGSDYSVVVKSDFHGDWSDCVDTCRQTVGDMGVCGDVENLFNCVANSCPDEKQVFSESLEGVLLNDCYCEGDSDSCQEISMIERGAGARRSLGEWPPPSSEALNGACNANEVEIFVDMTDSYVRAKRGTSEASAKGDALLRRKQASEEIGGGASEANEMKGISSAAEAGKRGDWRGGDPPPVKPFARAPQSSLAHALGCTRAPN
jgi:hypothetical protein